MQTIRHPLPFVQMRHSQRRHTHNGVHRRSDVVTHIRKEIRFCPIRFLRGRQRFFQSRFRAAFGKKHIGDVRPHYADSLAVLISPKHVDLFIANLRLRTIGKHEIVTARLRVEAAKHRLQTQLLLRRFVVRRSVMPRKAFYLATVILHDVGGQIFQNRFTGIHDEPFRARVYKTRQLERIGDHIQKPLLFPHRIGNVRADKAYPPQPQIYRGNRRVFRADISFLIRQRIGKGI